MSDTVFKKELEVILSDVGGMMDGAIKLTPEGSLLFAWFVRWGASLADVVNDHQRLVGRVKQDAILDQALGERLEGITQALEVANDKVEKLEADDITAQKIIGDLNAENTRKFDTLLGISTDFVDKRNSTALHFQGLAKEAITNARRNQNNQG